MKIPIRFLLTTLLGLWTGASVQAANPEVLECRLHVTGTGDFALHSISARILGTAFLDDPKHPDLFMLGDKYYKNECFRYSCVDRGKDGVPVFERKERIKMPDGALAKICIRQRGKRIYLFWCSDKELRYAEYDAKKAAFLEKGALPLPEMKWNPKNITVELPDDGSLRISASCTIVSSTKAPGNWRAADYFPYDGTGVWRGRFGADGFFSFNYPKFPKGTASEPQFIAASEKEIFGSSNGIDVIRYPGQDGIITGSSYGGLYFLTRKADGTCEPKRHIVDETFNALRHPTIWPTPVVYPNEQGEYVDLLATGEGGAFYYRFTGKFASDGRPVYDDPVTLKEKNPALYAGSLVTPTLVDWDGDGKLDIVCGNSAGHILFFRNAGTNRNPSFRSGTYLKAGNEIIHIQPGYGEDIQGPGESRWGYVGANVFDWNNDGKPDILTNDSRGKHTVFMQGANGLEAGKSIYLNDLELHGMWRCRPGVGTMAGKYVYFTLDDQDEIHRYFREDDYNLTDGGKMKLTDGSSVKANWLEAGGKGRLRFEIVDWDGDGIKDLLLATNMHHMIPDTIRGIPWSRPKPLRGATLLFLRNAGTEADPVFEFPKQLKYKGELVRFGHHGCGASPGMIGKITDGLPNVVVGDERGSISLLEREHLSW